MQEREEIMKKFAVLMLTLFVAFSLVACGNSSEDETGKTEGEQRVLKVDLFSGGNES